MISLFGMGRLRSRRIVLAVTIIAILSLVGFSAGCAKKKEKFPSKAVTFIVPMSPGGGVDTMSRGIASYVQKYLGQPLVVENVPGPGSVNAIAQVMKAPKDGYTIMAVTTPIMISIHLYEKQMALAKPFMESWKPIFAFLTGDGNGLAVRKGTFKDINALVAEAKKRTLKVGGATGFGSSDHATLLQFADAYGGSYDYIPHGGGGEAMASLLGGKIDALMISLSGDAVDLSRVDILGVSIADRFEGYPNIPTFKELGHPELTLNWAVGAYAPPDVPDDVVKTLETAFDKAFHDPDFQKWAKQAKKPIGTGWNAKQWGDFLKGYEASALKILPKMQAEMQKAQSGK